MSDHVLFYVIYNYKIKQRTLNGKHFIQIAYKETLECI